MCVPYLVSSAVWKHRIPFGRLALKIYCVLSFTEDVGRCLDRSNEIAGGGGKTSLGFVERCWKWKGEPGRWVAECAVGKGFSSLVWGRKQLQKGIF